MGDKKITILSICLNDLINNLKEKVTYLSSEYQEHLNESIENIEDTIEQLEGGKVEVSFLIQKLQEMEHIVKRFNQHAQNEAIQNDSDDASELQEIYDLIVDCKTEIEEVLDEDIKSLSLDLDDIQEERAIEDLTLAWDKSKESNNVSDSDVIDLRYINKIELMEFHEDKENPYYNLPTEIVTRNNISCFIKCILRRQDSSFMSVMENLILVHSEDDLVPLLKNLISAKQLVNDLTDIEKYKISIFLRGVIIEERIRVLFDKVHEHVEINFNVNNSNNESYFEIQNYSSKIIIKGEPFVLLENLNDSPYNTKHSFHDFYLSVCYLRSLKVKNLSDEEDYMCFIYKVYVYLYTMVELKIDEIDARRKISSKSLLPRDNSICKIKDSILKITNEKTKTYLLNRLDGLDKDASCSEFTKEKKYFERVLTIPFNNYSKLNDNIKDVYSTLNESHFGLNLVKERILEIISVYLRSKDSPPPVICFVGAPGVGKTSLIYSIAKAMNRVMCKININGIIDPNTLVGSESHYVGARHGRISEALINSKVMNPLILLDEIDKVSKDRSSEGTVGNILLGILDPTQNHEFHETFFGFELDLSKCMFICTANEISQISKPLLDRLQVINLDGYSNEEKFEIAKTKILPKLIKSNGIRESDNLEISDEVLTEIVNNYTQELGVRKLEECLDLIFKKYIYESDVLGRSLDVSPYSLEKIIQKPKIIKSNKDKIPGEINGMYVNSASGGGLGVIQALILEGKGDFKVFGVLGDMAKNSSQIIRNLISLKASDWNIDKKILNKKNICINFGGSSKSDGPSAGVTMVCAILSAIKQKPVSNEISMTGEIDLFGNVLSIGGCYQKILGVKREGVKKIFFPIGNKGEVDLIPDDIKNGIKLIFVKHIDEILKEINLI